MKSKSKMTKVFVWSLVPIALVLMLSLRPGGTQAATFDIPDGDVAGLIAAINTANTNPGADTINLAPGGTYTLTMVDNPGNGLPIITSQITINGNGATIQRSTAPGIPDFRIFQISSLTGDLTLDRVTIRGGRSGAGGGLFNEDHGTLRLVDSTVTDNGGGEGGGIFNFRPFTVGKNTELFIVNSTISHNTGFGGRTGGGILNFGGMTTIINSTIFENRADGPPGFQGRGDAIADAFSGPGSIIVKNSILASPTRGLGGDCNIAAGVLTSLGHNIASDTSCVGLTGSGDLNSSDPLLGPLANNGGLTQTHAPLLGSPAIDAVPLADCTDANGNPIATDQRSVVRPQGAACDIGAYEVEVTTCLQPPSGMIAWLPGDGNANDIVGGNNGTLVGATIDPAGMVDQAFSFDGVNDFVAVPNSASLNPGGSFSIDAWVYPRSNGIQTIVAKWGDTGDQPNQRSYGLINTTTGALNFGISDAAHQVDGAFHTLLTPPGVLTLNAWNHVAVVYDQPIGIRKIFVNGGQQATRTDPPITVLNSVARFGIGAHLSSSTTSAAHFDGLIDEVEFFNRALSASEIQAIFNAGSAGKCKTVVNPNHPPVANAGPDQTVEATSPSGASVTLNGSGSSDPDGDPLTYNWTGPFGAVSGVSPTVTLQLGTHTVTLTVNDGQATATDTVYITVHDTTPPDTNINSAVDGNGAAVASGGSTLSNSITFTFGGTDAVGVAGFQCRLDGAAYAPCASPVGYSALAIGSHTFQVRALDAAGNVDPSPASFTWTVVTPAQAIQNLITTIGNMGLPGGVANSLSAPLSNINTNNQTATCNKLNAFINQVNAKVQNGQLTSTQAGQLLQAANAIKASLGC